MLGCSLVCGVHLAVVVTAAAQAPNLVVGVVLDHLKRALITAKEVLTHEGAVLSLVGLVVTVGCRVHEVEQGTLIVFVEQGIPLATPDNLDDVPAGTAEEAFELLNDLAVAANGAVETLQVAVHDEGEVIEPLVRCDLELAAAFDLVKLTVTEERPDVLV